MAAAALVLVAFGHRPLVAGSSPLPDASAYAFPDGSIPTICVTLPGEDGTPAYKHRLPCDACLITASAILPLPADLSAPAYRILEGPVRMAAGAIVARRAWPPSAPPRAPPLA